MKKNIGPKWKATFENIKTRVAAVIGKIEKADLFLSFFNISDFIHPESDVFCFDDLERISKNLPVEDVLGFVNSELVEHKKCKVIFIGDETKRQLAESEYLKAKEKVIGWTTHYQPDIENIFELILPNFQHNLKFHLFLKKHQPFIVKLINSFDCNNLRTINFFLDCLKNIFSAYNNFNNDSIELKNASIARNKTFHALEGFEENYSDDVFEQVVMHSAKLCSELTSIHEKIKKEQIIKRIKNKFDLWKDYIDDKDLFVAIIQNIDAIEIYNYIIDNLNDRTFLEKLYLAIRDSHRKISIHYLKGYSISLQTLGKKLEEAYNSNSFTIIDNYWIKSLMDKVNEIAKFLDSEKIQ